MTNLAPTAPPPALTPFANSLLTTFGLGYARPFSGTWGSLPPVALAALFLILERGQTGIPYHAALIATLILFTTVCATHGDYAEARYNKKDPSQVVADETAGMCIPLLLLNTGPNLYTTASALLIAFITFRIFDILKPWPANGLQRVPGGWGIVLDDLAAGIYALITTQIITHLLW